MLVRCTCARDVLAGVARLCGGTEGLAVVTLARLIQCYCRHTEVGSAIVAKEATPARAVVSHTYAAHATATVAESSNSRNLAAPPKPLLPLPMTPGNEEKIW